MPKKKHEKVCCPSCGQYVTPVVIGQCTEEVPYDDGSLDGATVPYAYFHFCQCPKCTSPIVTVWAESFPDNDPSLVVYPLPPFTELVNEVSKVPQDVRKDLLQADRCYHNKLFNAFGAMARRVVHSICAAKGAYEAPNLHQQIEDIEKRNLITGKVASYMHSLRTMGRNGAHPEWEEVTPEMAEKGMKILLWLVKEVYEIDFPELPVFAKDKRYVQPKRPKK